MMKADLVTNVDDLATEGLEHGSVSLSGELCVPNGVDAARSKSVDLMARTDGAIEGLPEGLDLSSPRWPFYDLGEPLDEIVDRRTARVMRTMAASVLVFGLLPALVMQSAVFASVIVLIATGLAFFGARNRITRRLLKDHASGILRECAEQRRDQLVSLMAPSDRCDLERLEWMVEHVRGFSGERGRNIDSILADRLDRLLYHYVRMAIDHRRMIRAYELVATESPSGLRSHTELPRSQTHRRLENQRRHLMRLRVDARRRCRLQLATARELLSIISELVTLIYEQCLCRSVPLKDLVARIDDTLDDLENFSSARAELEGDDDEGATEYRLRVAHDDSTEPMIPLPDAL